MVHVRWMVFRDLSPEPTCGTELKNAYYDRSL